MSTTLTPLSPAEIDAIEALTADEFADVARRDRIARRRVAIAARQAGEQYASAIMRTLDDAEQVFSDINDPVVAEALAGDMTLALNDSVVW